MGKPKTKIKVKKGKFGTKIANLNARLNNVDRPTQKLICRSNLVIVLRPKKNGKVY